MGASNFPSGWCNLADRHQIIGVTCSQGDHFIDKDSDMFDLAIAA
ncbi:hypothetical protein [Pseudomonas syringae]